MNDHKEESHEEEKLQKKIESRERKKRKHMPVSGKHVFTIKKILDEKE